MYILLTHIGVVGDLERIHSVSGGHATDLEGLERTPITDIHVYTS